MFEPRASASSVIYLVRGSDNDSGGADDCIRAAEPHIELVACTTRTMARVVRECTVFANGETLRTDYRATSPTTHYAQSQPPAGIIANTDGTPALASAER